MKRLTLPKYKEILGRKIVRRWGGVGELHADGLQDWGSEAREEENGSDFDFCVLYEIGRLE